MSEIGDEISTSGESSSAPHVGGWGWAILFFGILGAAVGYFSTKADDPRRANHIMKWGLIWTIPGIVLWALVPVLLLTAVLTSGSSSSTAGGPAAIVATTGGITPPTPIPTAPASADKSRCPLQAPPATATVQEATEALVSMKQYAIDHQQVDCATQVFADTGYDGTSLFTEDSVITGDKSFTQDPGDVNSNPGDVRRNIPGSTFTGFERSYELKCDALEKASRCVRVVYGMQLPTGAHYDEYAYLKLPKGSHPTWRIMNVGYLTHPR